MKVRVPYQYLAYVIPPRCRKSRPQEFRGEMTVSIREVTGQEAPIAIIQHTQGHDLRIRTRENSWRKFDVVYRWYKGQLYTRALLSRSCQENSFYQSIEEFRQDPLALDGPGRYYALLSKAETRQDIMAWARGILFIDGERWKPAGEPRYVVMTFGLGHNHGGSSLSTDNHYNGNISKNRYFRIDEFDKAMASFIQTALGRGDNKSVPSTHHDTFEVLIPEAIRCQPHKEHGNGDPFVNGLEDLITGSGSMIEAGALVMAKTLKEVLA